MGVQYAGSAVCSGVAMVRTEEISCLSEAISWCRKPSGSRVVDLGKWHTGGKTRLHEKDRLEDQCIERFDRGHLILSRFRKARKEDSAQARYWAIGDQRARR